MNRIEELIKKQDELKCILRNVQHELINEVEQFDGTLREALSQGLVRLNFPVPVGYYRSLIRVDKII